MGTEALVVLVLTITQLGKGWVKTWFKLDKLQSWMVVALSFLVSAGVVGYSYIKAGTPFEFVTYIGVVFSVFALANGGKKLLSSLKPK